MSKRRARSAYSTGIKKDPETGKNLCRWCEKPVTAPRRRTFCSEECVHEWKVRSDPGYVRMVVERRDKGICQGCSINVGFIEQFFRAYRTLKHQFTPIHPADYGRANKRHTFYSGHGTFRYIYDEDLIKWTGLTQDQWSHELSDRTRRLVARRLRRTARLMAREFWGQLPEWVQERFPDHRQYRWSAKHLWEADHIEEVADGGGECGLDNYQTLCLRCHWDKSAESRKKRNARKKKGS